MIMGVCPSTWHSGERDDASLSFFSCTMLDEDREKVVKEIEEINVGNLVNKILLKGEQWIPLKDT